MHNLSPASVYTQCQRFKAAGLGGLPDKPKRGRPRKATPEYVALLEQTLNREPKDSGYGFTVWTQARLRHYLAQQTGIALRRRRFQALLDQLGYGYRRPKRDLGQRQDPQVRQQGKAALDELKKQPPQTPLSYSVWIKPKSD